jgi:valyl-tRNA synthetase
MKKIYEPALNAVANDEIRFHPAKYKNLYRHWMENIKDWCISRQLWWGHQIPAWYDAEGRFVVAMDEAEAVRKFKEQHGIEHPVLHQDEDCLDTWFSSWLWPFEVFKGISNPGNPEVKYYYPTNALVTAPEIIFFWVARMIMAGFEYMDEKPFREVYFTGIVRDKQGRKMSKQLGNSPDLLEMIDEIGADAVRFGILISSPAGNDLLWDQSSNEQGRNFINKIWNALKLLQMWKDRGVIISDAQTSSDADWPNRWFEARLAEVRLEVDKLMEQYRLSEALKTIYSLVWDDFCSWYLEWIKPAPEQLIRDTHLEAATGFFESLMEMLHPFMPFLTEEVYHLLRHRADSDDLCIRQTDTSTVIRPDADSLAAGELLKSAISGIRDARNKARLKPKDSIRLACISASKETLSVVSGILCKQVNATSLDFTEEPVAGAIPVVIGKDRFFISSEQAQDDGVQRAEMEKELVYLTGFLESVEKKLSNERFIQNAKPEVIENERKKQADAQMKIATLREGLANLG